LTVPEQIWNIFAVGGGLAMPRGARIVFPGVPHHVTQRGNRRQTVFFCADDYRAYLNLAAQACREAGVEVWAYCLMPNHVHLVASPTTESGLASAIGAIHSAYARQINRRREWTGHLWQGRFASFAMEEQHLLNCVRYVGLNPVRAGLVRRAIDWPWSSVRAHVVGDDDGLLTRTPVAERLGIELAGFFDEDLEQADLHRFRQASVNGRPVGSCAWLNRHTPSEGDRHGLRPSQSPAPRST
jgi:putative transposase